MRSCRNAIESVVFDEVKVQVERLSPESQQQINPNEIAAYSLNRLPTFYATTERGWVKQCQRCREECGMQITKTVRQSLINISRVPLQDVAPLPSSELDSQERSLAKLQRLLGKEDLQWRDVPRYLDELLEKIKRREAIGRTRLSMNQLSVADAQDSIRRARERNLRHGERGASERLNFASYMEVVNYGFSNVLENIVQGIALRQMQRLELDMRDRISLEEVAAYALNRLPPMYATTDRGWQQLRRRVKAEMSNEILSIVRQGIIKVGQQPERSLPPLPFEKFNVDQDEALEALRMMLNRQDINWRNVADVVEETIEELYQRMSDATTWLAEWQI